MAVFPPMALLWKIKLNFKFYNKKIAQSCGSLVFPSFCLECSVPTERFLCPGCLDLLELLDPEMEIEPPPHVTHLHSCFEYLGPIQKIVSAFKYQNHPYLAQALAGFLFIQFERLLWQQPDIVTFVPQFFLRTKIRGYNQSERLAHELALLLKAPLYSLLQKRDFLFSQSLLSKKGRTEHKENSITLKNKNPIEDKCVLLIDDVYTTGKTIESVAKALALGYPKSIYVLTLCRSQE